MSALRHAFESEGELEKITPMLSARSMKEASTAQPSEPASRRWLVAGLSACVLGLLLCPLVYIAMGALAAFSLVFSAVALPLLLVSLIDLMRRYLSIKPMATARPVGLALEITAWLWVAAFLAIVSNFSLFTTVERVGLAATIFLATTAFSCLVTLKRRTLWHERFGRWSSPVLALALAGILSLAVAAVVVDSLHAPALI